MEKQSKGIQSVEYGFEIIESFLKIGRPVTLGEAAAHTGIAKSKLHKYLTSFVRLEVIKQDGSGLYSSGPKLLELGLGILGRMDIVSVAEPDLQLLRAESGEAAALALWTANGPFITRFLPSPKPAAFAMRVGFYAPVTASATGLCFAAFLPETAYSHLLDFELGDNEEGRSDFTASLDEVVSQGYSARLLPNKKIPGAKAFACPIFDGSRNINACILLIGFEDDETSIPESDAIRLLKKTSVTLSSRLGFKELDVSDSA